MELSIKFWIVRVKPNFPLSVKNICISLGSILKPSSMFGALPQGLLFPQNKHSSILGICQIHRKLFFVMFCCAWAHFGQKKLDYTMLFGSNLMMVTPQQLSQSGKHPKPWAVSQPQAKIISFRQSLNSTKERMATEGVIEQTHTSVTVVSRNQTKELSECRPVPTPG